MSQSHNIVHNRNDKGNSSTIVTDDNGAWSLFQSCVDDIPFQFNPKYRHITIVRQSFSTKKKITNILFLLFH